MKWVVGALIAVVVGWAVVSTTAAAPVSIDETSLKFLPADTIGIAVIDMNGLRSSPLAQDFLKTSNKSVYPRDLQEFSAATGLKPEQDLDKITAAKISAQEGIVIAQGRIDRFKVEQFFKDRGQRTEAYLGQSFYVDGDRAVAVFDNLVVAGQLNALKKAIDHMQVPGSAPLRTELRNAIQTIEAGNQVWAVGEFSVADVQAVGVQSPSVEILKSLRNGSYQMRLDTGLHARAIGNFADAESARNLEDMANGALGLARLNVAGRQPEFAQLLDGIQVSASGNALTIRIEQSGELLEKLKNARMIDPKLQ